MSEPTSLRGSSCEPPPVALDAPDVRPPPDARPPPVALDAPDVRPPPAIPSRALPVERRGVGRRLLGLWRRAPWLPGLVLTALFVVLVATRYGEARELLVLIRGIDPSWLLAAAAFQGLTYLCTPLIWQRVVARCQPAPPLRGLLPLAFAKLFLDQAVPTGGISGTALVVRGLERRRVPTPLAIAAVVVDLLGYYVAYALGVAATLVILARHGRLETPLLVLVATFALVAVAMVVALLWLTLRDSPPAWARRFRPGQRLLGAFAAAPAALVRDPRLLAQGAVLRGAVFLLDAATLAMMLRAIGQPAPAGAVIAAFLMGSVAATVGPLPAGVGTFEAGAAATLGLLGIPAAAALTATLLLRAVTFWLPMLPGFLLSRREVSGPAAGAAPGRAALGPADPAPPG